MNFRGLETRAGSRVDPDHYGTLKDVESRKMERCYMLKKRLRIPEKSLAEPVLEGLGK